MCFIIIIITIVVIVIVIIIVQECFFSNINKQAVFFSLYKYKNNIYIDAYHTLFCCCCCYFVVVVVVVVGVIVF